MTARRKHSLPGVKTELEMPDAPRKSMPKVSRKTTSSCTCCKAPRRRSSTSRRSGRASRRSSTSRTCCSRSATASSRMHDYTRAFECCLRVQTRNPGWHGLSDRVNNVLFAEGSKALIDGDGERGLRLLRELLGRKRDYPGLLEQIGEAYGKRIERALSARALSAGKTRAARARGARRRSHPGEADARPLHQEGQLNESGRRSQRRQPNELDALAEALRIWPTLEGAESHFTTRRSSRSRRWKWR